MGTISPTESQLNWLRSFNSILAVLYLCNLIFASLNLSKYLRLIKERSTLVVLFYVLVFFVCVPHLTSCIYSLFRPWTNSAIYGEPGLQVVEFIDWIGSCSMLALDWVVVCTMYHLLMVIKSIVAKLEAAEAA